MVVSWNAEVGDTEVSLVVELGLDWTVPVVELGVDWTVPVSDEMELIAEPGGVELENEVVDMDIVRLLYMNILYACKPTRCLTEFLLFVRQLEAVRF